MGKSLPGDKLRANVSINLSGSLTQIFLNKDKKWIEIIKDLLVFTDETIDNLS